MTLFFRLMFWCACLGLSQTLYAEMRDPTKPESAQEGFSMNEVQGWELQAIIFSKERKIAIFNGHIVRRGSMIGDFKVVAIKPNTVHLVGPDGKMTLFLFNQNVKRLSAKQP